MKLILIAVFFLIALVNEPTLAEENEAVIDLNKLVGNNGATSDEQAAMPEEDAGSGNGETSEAQGDETRNEQEAEEDEDEDVDDNSPQEDAVDAWIPKELQDEVEEVKRKSKVFPRLPVDSCRLLKRYGYCRKSLGIWRFCPVVCRPCRNKLSSLSCRLVLTKYKACKAHIGRFYCRKTCRYCGSKKLPIQCKRHVRINDGTRAQKYNRGKKPPRCDNRIKVGWYRLVGATGTQMPTKCTKANHCGTHASGWLVGNHPKARGQTVRRQVCFSWNKKCCYNAKWWKIFIQVTNCGNFYVYQFQRPKACSYRYCGNKM